MNKLLACLIFILALNLGLNAGSNLDSLEKAIYAKVDSKVKVDELNHLSWEYEFDNPEKSLSIIDNALKIAEKLNYKKGIAQCYNDMGVCYSIQGKTEACLTYYIKSLKIKEEINDVRGVGISYINIGQVYSDQKQYDKALSYYSKALQKFVEINNETEIAATYNSIGTIYEKRDRYDSAQIYFERSLEIRKKQEDKPGIAECYGNLAVTFKNLKDFESAEKYFLMDLELTRELGNSYNVTISYTNLALLYADQGQFDKAIEMTKKSLAISEEHGFLENQKYAVGNIADFYSAKKDYTNAYKYLSQYFVLYDSLNNASLSRTLNDLEIKYETDKKEQQNKLLQAENALSTKTIKQQRLITYFIIGGLLIVSFLAFFIFKGLKKQRKANFIISKQKDLVEHQRDIIEEKHKEITDSINYAERIQRSFLATTELLNANLKEYFVYFQPKDVVSGDFYWAAKLHNDKFALVTADSTGHGVPGAIMSLLNITSLEKAIESYIRPSDILNSTRKTIIERLKKDGSPEGGKDGMDASLIVFDFANKKFSYAAANNPVWVVRVAGQEGTPEMIELPCDKMPIGKHDKDSISFTEKEFELQTGDVVYALTDGMPDQFGGPKGKKYMYKQLKEFLVSIAHLPMNDQKQLLKQSFDNWKGNTEQVDDVCLIGVRV